MVSAAVGHAPTNKWLVAVSVTFGTLMGTIDASIVNVAIPHLQAGVGATVEQIAWVSTGFIIANVIVMPLTAFLGRLFGQKQVYMFCLGLFVVGSMLCGMARSLTALVLFRVIQGLGAGALQPTEQAILRQTFPPQEQGMAMAVFGMAVMIGPALGPTLGGYIVDHYSWPWIFYINLPVGVLGLLMVGRFVAVPEDILAANRALAEKQRQHMDWAGIALLAVGLSAMQFVLEEGNRKDWWNSSMVTVSAILSIVTLVAFVLRERSAVSPAVNLTLFRDRVFLSGTLIASVMFAMLFAVTFLLPYFMQTLLGFSALQSGLTLMPRTLIMMVATPFVGRFYNRISPRLVVGLGVILFAMGAYQMSHFTLQTGTVEIISSLLVQGLGFSCLFVPLTTVALSTIPRHRMSDATGLNSLLRQIGGSIGLAVFTTLLTRYATEARAHISWHLTPGQPVVRDQLSMIKRVLMGRGLDQVSADRGSLAVLGGRVARQGLVIAFERLFMLSGALFLGVLPLLLLLRTNRSSPGQKPPQAPRLETVHLE
jgi:MFS transporter, DHA2 family, multidrug resistance protein